MLAAQVAVDNAKPSVIRSQNLVRSARAQLRFLLAEPDDVDVEGTLGATVQPLPSYEAALSAALKKDQLSAAGYAQMIASTTKLNTPGPDLAELDALLAEREQAILEQALADPRPLGSRVDGNPVEVEGAVGHRRWAVADVARGAAVPHRHQHASRPRVHGLHGHVRPHVQVEFFEARLLGRARPRGRRSLPFPARSRDLC